MFLLVGCACKDIGYKLVVHVRILPTGWLFMEGYCQQVGCAWMYSILNTCPLCMEGYCLLVGCALCAGKDISN